MDTNASTADEVWSAVASELAEAFEDRPVRGGEDPDTTWPEWHDSSDWSASHGSADWSASQGSDWMDWSEEPAGRVGASPDFQRGARSDAGEIRLTDRDVAALLLVGEMYGVQADLLEAVLSTTPAAVRQVAMRWRRAGLVETGRLGFGPGWCWLTKKGLQWCGLDYTPRRPTLSRLAHLRAGVAVRLTLEAWPTYRTTGASWRSERRLRALHGSGPGGGRSSGGVGRRGHVPDGEILWLGSTDPSQSGGPVAAGLVGQVWAVEVELTPKAGNRTAGVMAELLGRTADYGEPATTGGKAGPSGASAPRYGRVLYVVSSAARATVEAARASLPAQAAARIEIQPLPAGALLNTGTTTGGEV